MLSVSDARIVRSQEATATPAPNAAAYDMICRFANYLAYSFANYLAH
jgi:hypothetical protein